MKECNVIFLDDDQKTVLANIKVEYGASAIYPKQLPVKEAIQGIKYSFIGWDGEEKLLSVTEDVVVIAKYEVETGIITDEQALYDSSLENAEEINYNVVVEAGNKIISQEKALEKDSRTPEEIVSDIIKNGKTEIGQDINKDNVER